MKKEEFDKLSGDSFGQMLTVVSNWSKDERYTDSERITADTIAVFLKGLRDKDKKMVDIAIANLVNVRNHFLVNDEIRHN